MDTIGGIVYFANGVLNPNGTSLYLSNIHSVTLGTNFTLGRVDVYAGYSLVKDTGDGRSNPYGSGVGNVLPAFQAAQTFPMAFHSPMTRVSVRLHERVRWNAGYQYYGFREDFFGSQGFRANTGYTSLSWSF